MVRGRGPPRRRRNRPDVAKAGCSKSRSLFRAGACSRASTAGEVLGAACGYEHDAAVARPREAGRGPRTSRPGLRLVHRGFDTLDLKQAKALLDELT